jgi:hypothetical protein
MTKAANILNQKVISLLKEEGDESAWFISAREDEAHGA